MAQEGAAQNYRNEPSGAKQQGVEFLNQLSDCEFPKEALGTRKFTPSVLFNVAIALTRCDV